MIIASIIVTYGGGYLNDIHLNESTFQSPHQTFKKYKTLYYFINDSCNILNEIHLQNDKEELVQLLDIYIYIYVCVCVCVCVCVRARIRACTYARDLKHEQM